LRDWSNFTDVPPCVALSIDQPYREGGEPHPARPFTHGSPSRVPKMRRNRWATTAETLRSGEVAFGSHHRRHAVPPRSDLAAAISAWMGTIEVEVVAVVLVVN